MSDRQSPFNQRDLPFFELNKQNDWAQAPLMEDPVVLVVEKQCRAKMGSIYKEKPLTPVSGEFTQFKDERFGNFLESSIGAWLKERSNRTLISIENTMSGFLKLQYLYTLLDEKMPDDLRDRCAHFFREIEALSKLSFSEKLDDRSAPVVALPHDDVDSYVRHVALSDQRDQGGMVVSFEGGTHTSLAELTQSIDQQFDTLSIVDEFITRHVSRLDAITRKRDFERLGYEEQAATQEMIERLNAVLTNYEISVRDLRKCLEEDGESDMERLTGIYHDLKSKLLPLQN